MGSCERRARKVGDAFLGWFIEVCESFGDVLFFCWSLKEVSPCSSYSIGSRDSLSRLSSSTSVGIVREEMRNA